MVVVVVVVMAGVVWFVVINAVFLVFWVSLASRYVVCRETVVCSCSVRGCQTTSSSTTNNIFSHSNRTEPFETDPQNSPPIRMTLTAVTFLVCNWLKIEVHVTAVRDFTSTAGWYRIVMFRVTPRDSFTR